MFHSILFYFLFRSPLTNRTYRTFEFFSSRFALGLHFAQSKPNGMVVDVWFYSLSFLIRFVQALSLLQVRKHGCICCCCCFSFCWTYAFQVCVYCVCILFASLFSQIQRYTVCTEFPFCALNQLFIHHLLPFFKQIFKFPNEDSKISKVKRKNRIFALVQQKIDNNKKVQLSHKTKQIRRE